MYADDLLVISSSPEGLQQSINVIQKHDNEWKLKVNTKKSNIIIFSGNGKNNNQSTFKYQTETLNVVDKQTYLGLELTSSGRYAYARDVLSTIKKSFGKTDTHFATLSDYDKIIYLLNLGNDNICKPVRRYIHLTFQKRREIFNKNVTK